MLLLGWMDVPFGEGSIQFDFFEVFAGKQACTKEMHRPCTPTSPQNRLRLERKREREREREIERKKRHSWSL